MSELDNTPTGFSSIFRGKGNYINHVYGRRLIKGDEIKNIVIGYSPIKGKAIISIHLKLSNEVYNGIIELIKEGEELNPDDGT